ncbi:carbon storage regulator CsrA [Sporomusa malonica]|uniref:Translational regulator CsrA n=1 Tax=Sporomusa malonica TaxID=112901 RepID=A0A1W1YUR2_9FIRM|nr:carbon storage regulator CsrA [Sporomusa malonica]SMC39853.1 carbon storage regulator, CsrA [Sporomusa malonica]
MLALTRKIGERIIVDDNIIFTVVDIKGDNVRLAIEAPKEIKIYRGEIYEAIINENKQSASPVNLNNMDMLKGIKTFK